MDKNAVLSLSSDKSVLASRELALRNGGMKVTSVLSATQARFEIEMGRCGILLICYRLQNSDADELTKLFRRYCPQGQIVFVAQLPDDRVPPETDISLPENSGPGKIVQALKERAERSASA
jgi:hypothetical protein